MPSLHTVAYKAIMSPYEQFLARLDEVEQSLGYAFKDRAHLICAFVHTSFYNEYREVVETSNERLEFLGDSVLGLIVSDFLYLRFPGKSEGDLSAVRSSLVEASCCAAFVEELGVARFLLLGKGEKLNMGRGRETILADLFEALLGAIYLDGGIEEARRWFFGMFRSKVEQRLLEPVRNWKAELQEYSQKWHQTPPLYKVLHESGPEHHKRFRVAAFIAQQEVGQGEGPSKREAEQRAAEDAMGRLT